jgi:hypothetical protein
MSFKVGDNVRVREFDAVRGGDVGTVKKVLSLRPGVTLLREYLLEFPNYPSKLGTTNDRFRLCIFREEELTPV